MWHIHAFGKKMESDRMKLVEPCLKLKNAFYRMVEDYRSFGEERYQKNGSQDYNEYIEIVRQNRNGINLPKDMWHLALIGWSMKKI